LFYLVNLYEKKKNVWLYFQVLLFLLRFLKEFDTYPIFSYISNKNGKFIFLSSSICSSKVDGSADPLKNKVGMALDGSDENRGSFLFS